MIFSEFKMHSDTMRLISAQQAKLHIYKNTKLKLLKTSAAIRFNKICRDKQLQPKHIGLKINARKATGQENSSQCRQISHKPGDQVAVQEATSQPATIPVSTVMCTSI